jgi:DnaJ homolog subfamily C member 7
LDPLNSVYNQTILYNRACALVKLGKTDEALADLDKAIEMNSEYVKAYFKKGDIKLDLEKFDEAMADYNKVKEFAPQTPGLQ